MIEIRIRFDTDGVSRHLTEVPLSELDTVIPTLRSWGLADAANDDPFGQFVIGDSSAYFEIVVGHE